MRGGGPEKISLSGLVDCCCVLAGMKPFVVFACRVDNRIGEVWNLEVSFVKNLAEKKRLGNSCQEFAYEREREEAFIN